MFPRISTVIQSSFISCSLPIVILSSLPNALRDLAPNVFFFSSSPFATVCYQIVRRLTDAAPSDTCNSVGFRVSALLYGIGTLYYGLEAG